MNKLRLNVDALEVESFATGQDADARGTVLGRVAIDDHQACPRTDESTCDPKQMCGCIPSWVITCAGASSCDVAAVSVAEPGVA
jgi:hypothetical protein